MKSVRFYFVLFQDRVVLFFTERNIRVKETKTKIK